MGTYIIYMIVKPLCQKRDSISLTENLRRPIPESYSMTRLMD